MGKYSWDNLKAQVESDLKETSTKRWEADERFYKLSKDKDGTGGALIRFIPDPNGKPFQKIIKINAQHKDRNSSIGKRFVDEYSLDMIGKPNPFQERFSELWNAGEKEKAKEYGRKIRYYANIQIVKDPANPDNEGRIFLLDMAPTLFGKLKDAVQPSESEMALDPDLKPLEVFNPVNGNAFLLKIKMGENGIPTYEDSKFQLK